MNKTLLLLLSLSLFGCQDFDARDSQNTTVKQIDKPIVEEIEWNTIKVRNFKFDLPSNMQLQLAQSNDRKKTYVDEKKSLGLTIDIELLPSGYEFVESVSELVPDIKVFGEEINKNNRKTFSDFILASTDYAILGNNSSILVRQVSTQISGKSIPMYINTYFVVTSPYYCTFTFSYPMSSELGYDNFTRIIKSFIF
jgi:hypothetical protein